MRNRHSSVFQDRVEYSFWLVFSSDGSMRFSRGEPSISPSERAMALTAKIPRALFRTPTLQAAIEVPSPAGDSSDKITADVRGMAESVLKQALGVDVVLTVRSPE